MIRPAPDLSPVPVRLAVPPLRPADLPPPVAPAVVSLAVPPLARPVPVSAAPASPPVAPSITAGQEAATVAAATGKGQAARWVHGLGPLRSLLLGLGLVLAVGWLVTGAGSNPPQWLAAVGGAAWGWYWWRGKPAGARLLAWCGGLVLWRSAALLLGFGSMERSDLGSLFNLLVRLLYFLGWCVLLTLGVWRGCRALVRALSARKGPVAAGPAGDTAAPSLFERAMSQQVQVEGAGGAQIIRIRHVSTAERIKVIYWSMRMVWFASSLIILAIWHDDIVRYFTRLGLQSAPIVLDEVAKEAKKKLLPSWMQ